MNNNLVPDIILDLIQKYKNSKNDTERTNYEMRLEAIVKSCEEELSKSTYLRRFDKKNPIK